MIKKVLDVLSENRIMNDLNFPYWIYDVNTVTAGGRKFIKIYLFDRTFAQGTLNSVTLLHQGRNQCISSFSVISDYNNKSVVGCVLEIEPHDFSSDVEIISEVVDNELIESSGEKVIFQENGFFPEDDIYLQSKREQYKKNHFVYPQIRSDYWQCSCGRIHNNKETMCDCGQSLLDNLETINFDFVKNHDEDKRIKDEQLRIEREAREARNKKIKKVMKIILPLLVLALLIKVFPTQYVKYLILRRESDLREKYIKLGVLDTPQSIDEADSAFRQRINALLEIQDYAGIVDMVENDNQYTTIVVEKKVNNSMTVNYVFNDKDVEDIYLLSRLELLNNEYSSDDFAALKKLVKTGNGEAVRLYAEYYANAIDVVINTEPEEYETHLDTLPINGIWYFHFVPARGIFMENKNLLKYSIEYPDGTVRNEQVVGYIRVNRIVNKQASYKDMKEGKTGALKLYIYLGKIPIKTVQVEIKD